MFPAKDMDSLDIRDIESLEFFTFEVTFFNRCEKGGFEVPCCEVSCCEVP